MTGRPLRKPNIRGFSLMEVIFGFLIIAILLGLTASNLKFSRDKEGARSLAYSLASDLRAARAEAQRSGKMVAVCFPSEGRTNSLSRSAIVRKGDQRGHISRILGYNEEYEATIFIGTWPDAILKSDHTVPIGWSISTQDAMAIYFRPDGSAFSNEIPAVGGDYPIVAATSFRGSTNGPNGTLTHAKSPHTVWVSSTGSVRIEENRVPSGTLPTGESALAIAEPKLSDEPSATTPTIVSASFLPEQVEGLATAHLGQNFVSVHPDQKEGSYLEYGFATIEIKARDLDGGPLTYKLEATASAGDEGEFSVSNLEGQLSYVYDEEERDYLWHTVISWRPPPGSPSEREYDLTVFVNDPDGNSVEVSSRAGLLPKVSNLPPSRLVMQTDTNALYLANLDGSNEIEITKNGEEQLPFFSADGSRIFSFYDYTDGSGKRELRSRIANGTTIFEPLATFDNVGTQVHFDPTFTFAAILVKDGQFEFPWMLVKEDTDSEGNTSYSRGPTGTAYPDRFKVLIVNLMSSDPPTTITSEARDFFKWAPRSAGKYKFKYGTREPIPMTVKGGLEEILSPGHQDDVSDAYLIDSHPPNKVPTTDFGGSASERAYNPAAPHWYLVVETGGLFAKNDDTGASLRLSSTSNIQNDHVNRKHPTWSSDGQHVAFIENPGAGGRLRVVRILDASHAPLGSVVTSLEINGNVSSAAPSPDGKWVYYLEDGELYRAQNSSGSSGVSLTERISEDIHGYAVSP